MTGPRPLPPSTPVARPQRFARPWRALLAAVLMTAAGAAAAQKLVSVDRDKINMRAGAGTGHEVLWSLSRGYPLMVTGQRGGWLHVRDFEGDTGWVLGRLTGRQPHMVVKVDRANLRSGPGTRYRAVGHAIYGEVLRTLQRERDWVKVKQAGGPTGWVARKLVWGW
jgi:uncharacterized protein YgiM (DUF1202 family)